jgi:hypothetical protein
MKKIKTGIIQVILCIVLNFSYFVAQPQNSISISAVNPVEMNFSAPINPGNPIRIITDKSKWLNYNITVDPEDPFVSITVEITSGTIPQGLQLELEASAFQSFGGGSPGTPAGKLTLGSQPQVLIENIGTCNSGTGDYAGHQLTYTFSISDYSIALSSLSSVEILFTITQTSMKFNRNSFIRQQSSPVRLAAPEK